MLQSVLAWFRSLSPVSLGVIALAATAVFVGGSVAAYRTYDYIEHDNDFCMSCHLMAEPFELFARSAHRDLGCKACHKPSFAGRSQMALAQIIENPEEITAHAHVPNEKCVSCHVDGDPDQWLQVASTAGHRVHLESQDPELQELQCVQCHSSGVHEFAATDQTCAQSSCHTDVEVKLGRMGDFAIHCAACHSFNTPVDAAVQGEELIATLSPTQNECMSCHAMRILVEMPPDEPHDQVCSTCHNPHEQETPADAVNTCATVGCHNDATELTAFHRGLDHLAVQDCGSCHVAHNWDLDGQDCLSCHKDIYDDDPTATPPGAGAAGPGGAQAVATLHTVPTGKVGVAGTRFVGLGVSSEYEASIHAATPGQRTSPGAMGVHPGMLLTQEARSMSDTVAFRHSQHRDVDCGQCHVSEDQHGEVTLDSLVDCRSCHHTAPEANECAECHAPTELNPVPTVARGWAMSFSTSQEAVRDVSFSHADHGEEDCATCHTEGLDRPFDVASCNSCHEEHHQDPVEAECITCHVTPLEGAHEMDSHQTCTGSGCHIDPPLQVVPRSRNSCLSCHQDLLDHEPQDDCIACHLLPEPVSGSHP